MWRRCDTSNLKSTPIAVAISANYAACLTRVTTSSNSFCYALLYANNNANTEMLQRARTALPLSKIRERAFGGAFFGVMLIAMASWVYFIMRLLVKLFLWFLG